ncbi:MAG: glycerophosphodiester phosphodiesterase [Acidobacteria bacterium]|nr:glycerophosphodiester phosphodiesterase [Acidobacteriota bacterium]
MIDVYAHRGLHQVERENTVAAFLAAKALGVTGVELDVRRTLDECLVVHHDPTVEGMVIATSRRGDLGDKVEDFDAVMEACRGMRVNVEIKNINEPSEPTYDASGDFTRQVLTVLHESHWADAVIVSCFDEVTSALVRTLDPDIAVGWLLWGVEPMSALTQAYVLGLNAVHPHFSLVTPEVMDRARELGVEVNVWTVNNASDIKAMAELGISSIITDDPALALSVVG